MGSTFESRRLTFACSPKQGQWPCGRCRTCFRADGKASIERLCLSPYVEKPLNSKVIKSFVPELKIVSVFRVLGSLCSMCIGYEHSMYVSHIRIMGMVQKHKQKNVCTAQPRYRKTTKQTMRKIKEKAIAKTISSPQRAAPKCSPEKEPPTQITSTPSKTNFASQKITENPLFLNSSHSLTYQAVLSFNISKQTIIRVGIYAP